MKSRRRVKQQRNNQTEQYAEVYSKTDYEKDENEFRKAEKNKSIDAINWNAFKRLMIHDIGTRSKVIETGSLISVKLEDIQKALQAPMLCWRTILAASEELMRISPHYYRLNMMFGNMALFCWGLDLFDVKENAEKAPMKKAYMNLAAKLDAMNIRHEFGKIMRVLPYQDVFFGVLVENSNDFFIQRLSYKICKIYQVQDGLYNFAINLAAINPTQLGAYPVYIQQAYLDFKDGLITNWYIPPGDKQICIKFNDQWLYPFPPLIGLIDDILDLNVYKKLKLQSARTDNYKAIMIKVPIDHNNIDKPLLTPETLGIFAEMNRDSLSDDIGLIHVLGDDGEAISFKDSTNTRNNVSDAVTELYNDSGESKELFNGSSSATAVTLSIENDAGFIYNIYRQFERWTNRWIKLRKHNKSSFKFHFYLLDITIFNRDSVIKRFKDASTLGITVVDKFFAALDMTPSRVLGSYVVHEDIFDYDRHLKPLSSTYTSTEKSKGGRPSNQSKGELLSESGEQTADSDANNDR